ncbi:hypothetical protein ACCS96_40505, partial [Rhizobium ruizarguesonis]
LVGTLRAEDGKKHEHEAKPEGSFDQKPHCRRPSCFPRPVLVAESGRLSGVFSPYRQVANAAFRNSRAFAANLVQILANGI